jgi:hypothetical protein
MKMKLAVVLFVLFMFGCEGALLNQRSFAVDSDSKQEKPLQGVGISSKNYLGYQPIDPIPVSKVIAFDTETKNEKEVFWQSLPDAESIRRLLPLQTAQFAVRKTDVSGQVTYLVSSLSAERGSYEVIMDYMKYRVQDVFGEDGDYIGNARVGVGLRIKALVITNKANLNLGSITAIGLQADLGHLSGGISVDVVGIDSEAVTNLIPLTSKIDETAIQSALQALASIKSKLWEDDTTITPHIIAIRQSKPDQEAKIRKQASTYMKSDSSDILRRYWKPDGKNINQGNEKKLKDWMSSNDLSVGPGSITMFLYGAEFEGLRKKAIQDLKLN